MDETDMFFNNLEKKKPRYVRCSYCKTYNRADPGDKCAVCGKGVME